MYVWVPLNTSADLADLEKHISAEYAPARVVKKLIDGISDAVKGVLIEKFYVDKDYRSTYYNFYSKKGLLSIIPDVIECFISGDHVFSDAR